MEFINNVNETTDNCILQPVIDGSNILKLREFLASDDLDNESMWLFSPQTYEFDKCAECLGKHL